MTAIAPQHDKPIPDTSAETSSLSKIPAPTLPIDVRDLVLSHLVPPRPPLPLRALSRTFLERLTFLPPNEDDLDAHLTPFAPMAKDARNPNALHAALEQLQGSLKVNDTEYAHDGEMTIARTRLQDAYGYGSYGNDEVEAYFEHEDGEKGRGWVYRGASLGEANVGANWDWKSRVDDVQPAAEYGYGGGGNGYDDAPEDYWAGFTPPNEHASIPDDENEDHYWAQYGAGAPDHHEPELEHDAEPVTPPAATVPAPDPAATLSLLLTGLGVDKPSENASPQTKSPISASPSIISQKVSAKVRAQLMRAWTDFSAGQDAESCAYEWLRITREIADRPSWSTSDLSDCFDVRSAVVKARVEAAKEMSDVLDTPQDFFRLCEEAIRVHSPPMDGAEEQPYEYES